MKKNPFITRHVSMGIAMAAMTVLFMDSCAIDGIDDEKFDDGVHNTQLSSPSADSITFTANADGSKTTIEWPVVYGAGGYLCSVYNVTDPSNPVAIVKDSTVDGTVLTVDRAEDLNYQFSIQTLGNVDKGNTSAADTTKAAFSSYAPAYATIPDGSDIYQWLQEHPLPTDSASIELPLNLVAGGHYTMSGNVDFNGNLMTLRTTDASNRATITVGANASLMTYNGLKLKNIIFDCAACTNSLILLNATPSTSIQNTVSDKGYYYIENPFYISNCYIKDLPNEFLNNNSVQYCIHTFIVDNSIFRFATGSDMGSATYFNMYNNGACINDFTAKNSTFYNTAGSYTKYFLRYNNAGGPARTGYSSASVTLSSCTFYNICKSNQICNYDKMKNLASVTFTLSKNIIVNTGNQQFVRRFLGGGSASDASIKKFSYNTYTFDGANAWTIATPGDVTTGTGEAQYDQSGTILSTDPGLKDPASGDFTVSGADQILNKTGDPRWLTTE